MPLSFCGGILRKIVNLDYAKQRDRERAQIEANQAYVKQLNNINEDIADSGREVVIKDDIETFRKIFKISADMTTEDSNVFKMLYYGENKFKLEEIDEIIQNALRLHTKKRKEIVKLATGETDLTTQQEVALCGAIFRVAVAVPALLELDGRSLSK